ncbi:MAG TPA: MOSC domain-containing protein [Nocardioides sp.]|jgi:MOSC domain-containing protein YiiM|uniref:MOSC domain-containing protein n=1 Tax=Nocardioides sp. TaxID=35761 RepID=UPI002E35899F|nr:MOSC domain-containing protein [Nocardioides sp.]HEX3930469.1 MOSC domain-containing protein [Nocardioides sp.]
MDSEAGLVAAVHRDDAHRFGKQTVECIRLLPGIGVEGDAHAGTTVQHRSRVRRDPHQPNLRQVHLLGTGLLERVNALGYDVALGALGENVTTDGIDLLALPRGACLRLGDHAVVEVTGLRNPCAQIDAFRRGLLKEVLRTTDDGRVERLAGVMGIVLVGGVVRPGDPVLVELPEGEHRLLEPV